MVAPCTPHVATLAYNTLGHIPFGSTSMHSEVSSFKAHSSKDFVKNRDISKYRRIPYMLGSPTTALLGCLLVSCPVECQLITHQDTRCTNAVHARLESYLLAITNRKAVLFAVLKQPRVCLRA